MANAGQEDAEGDTIGDACDTCPAVANIDQNPCACNACVPLDITISFDTDAGRGSGLLGWRTGLEHDILGFNVVVLDNQGTRVQLNPVLISCTACVTDVGQAYSYLVPKHRSGRNLYVEQIRRDGSRLLYGPAVR